MKCALKLAVMLPVVLGGCGREPDRASSTSAVSGRAARAPIRLAIVDVVGFERVLEKYRGRVVLVDCWATWCKPCREQFAHTVSLSRQYADQGLAVISLSFDDPANQDNVLRFLQQQQATFQNLLSEYGGGSTAMENFAVEGGALPHYKIFDRAGNLAATFSLDPTSAAQFIPAEVEAKVREVLADR